MPISCYMVNAVALTAAKSSNEISVKFFIFILLCLSLSLELYGFSGVTVKCHFDVIRRNFKG